MDMSNFSILDQILSNQKIEEVADLDAVEIINNLFSELSDRERDVVIRRYGLHGQGKETLESIGGIHQLTRERIRQLETSSIKKLQQLDNLGDYLKTLKRVIYQLLEEHGGVMEREYLLNILVVFSLNGFKQSSENEIIHKNYLNFLITKLLHDEFEEVVSSSYFRHIYKLKHQTLEHLEELADELIENVKTLKKIQTTEELINFLAAAKAYDKHRERFTAENALDISRVLKSELYEENTEIVNSHKPLYSLLKAIKKLKQNKFGSWGINNWREIQPKTINDKIYLVLKHTGRPMHFGKIAERINEIGFDKKTANPATVHNELILDDKYVLIGRGIYSLKEWGYEDGTVTQVIENILRQADEPKSRDEIIDKVLEKRLVKKATIILALMNRLKFEKVNGKYSLKA